MIDNIKSSLNCSLGKDLSKEEKEQILLSALGKTPKQGKKYISTSSREKMRKWLETL